MPAEGSLVGALLLQEDIRVGRVLCAMSGGVDSSVAAALLLRQGFEVIGVTMQLWDHTQSPGKSRGCCTLGDVQDARIVAQRLGIPHYLVNYQDEFRTGVVDYFADEYFSGRTPNPCVMCNSRLKFDHLLDRAEILGADYVATGHYARVVQGSAGVELWRAADSQKDQSYFLFGIPRSKLDRVLFPLGEMTKPEVRALAHELGLVTAAKKDSQEICFVAGQSYSEFLERHYGERPVRAGSVVDDAGRVLGRHDGIHRFTVGQRKGLPVQSTDRLYVKSIQPDTGEVRVADRSKMAIREFSVTGLASLVDDLEGAAAGSWDDVSVATRYRARPVPCRVEMTSAVGENGHSVQGGRASARVRLSEDLPWVSPGQAAVFYRGDQVLGGGWIRGS